jgi:Glycosyltransferase
MMRILHVTPSYKPAFRYGGPTFLVSCLAEQQAKAGAEVWVFTTTANGEEELPVCRGVPIEVEGVRVVYFSRWTGDHGHFCPALWWAVWRKGRNFDVVHVHSWWNWVAFGAVLIGRLRGLRMVFSPHGMLSPYTLRHSLKRWFQRILGRWLLARALWHATSRLEERELQVHKPPNPTICVPNITPFPDTTAIQAPGAKGCVAAALFVPPRSEERAGFLAKCIGRDKGRLPLAIDGGRRRLQSLWARDAQAGRALGA